MPTYTAFGLKIDSEFPLPELLRTGEQADTFIEIGKTPEELSEAKDKGVRFQTAPGKLLLKVDGIASFLVENGERITIAPNPTASEDEIRLFLLGSAFGALLHQRGMLVLHGSAVEKEGRAIALLGPSGVGKSTLATALQQNGYKLITDDICAISLNEDKQPIIEPAYPRAKLWEDSLSNLNIDSTSLRRVRPQLGKRTLAVRTSFCGIPIPLSYVYVLSQEHSNELTLTEVKGSDKFSAINDNTYRRQYLKGFGSAVAHFKLSSAIASDVPTSRVARPLKPFKLKELVALIRRDLER